MPRSSTVKRTPAQNRVRSGCKISFEVGRNLIVRFLLNKHGDLAALFHIFYLSKFRYVFHFFSSSHLNNLFLKVSVEACRCSSCFYVISLIFFGNLRHFDVTLLCYSRIMLILSDLSKIFWKSWVPLANKSNI